MTAPARCRSLIAVPGLGLSERVVATTLRLLGPAWRTGVVRLPGYGDPGTRRTPVDPGALAERLLGRLGRPAVLLGHSASCHVVVEAARRAPEQVAGLVLVGPTGDPRTTARTVLLARWLRTAVHEHAWEAPILARDYHRTGPAVMTRALAAARRHRIADALAEVAAPTLVARGWYDRIAPVAWTARLAAAAPSGTAVSLPGGAHMVPLTHPGPLAARIRASFT